MSRSGPNSYKKFTEEVTTLMLPTKDVESRRSQQDRKDIMFSVDRRLVRVAVNKHASIVRQKFPEVDLNELAESVHLILQSILNRTVQKTPGVEWFDSSRKEIITNNFRKLQDFMTIVKQEVRYEARRSIDESKRLAIQEKQVASAIVLGGIDVRDQAQGGDLIKSDLKDGRIVKESELAPERRTALQSINKKRGIQIGHAFGPGIGNVAAFTDNAEVFDLFSPLEQAQLMDFRKRAKKIDARLTIEANLLKKAGKNVGEITIVYLESTAGNSAEGAKLGRRIISRLKKIVAAKANELLKIYGSSPTIIHRYENIIIELFKTGNFNKAAAKGKLNFTTKSTKTVTEKIPVYGPKLKASKNTRPKRPKAETSTSLHDLLAFLNAKLERAIREDMGKGSSKARLNWRTGRFGRSAKIENLRAKGKIIYADVKYHGYPYTTFEKGGKLYKPLRDPKGIFGRSIRRILQEEKIATLSRVDVTLRRGT